MKTRFLFTIMVIMILLAGCQGTNATQSAAAPQPSATVSEPPVLPSATTALLASATPEPLLPNRYFKTNFCAKAGADDRYPCPVAGGRHAGCDQ